MPVDRSKILKVKVMRSVLGLAQFGLVTELQESMITRQEQLVSFNQGLMELKRLGLLRGNSKTTIKHALNAHKALSVPALILIYCYLFGDGPESKPRLKRNFTEKSFQEVMILLDRRHLITKYENYRKPINIFLKEACENHKNFKSFSLNENWLIVGDGLDDNEKIQKELFLKGTSESIDPNKLISIIKNVYNKKMVVLSAVLVLAISLIISTFITNNGTKTKTNTPNYQISVENDRVKMHNRFSGLMQNEAFVVVKNLADSCILTDKYNDIGLYFRGIQMIHTRRIESPSTQTRPSWYFREISTHSPYYPLGIGELLNYYDHKNHDDKEQKLKDFESLETTLKFRGQKHLPIYFFLMFKINEVKGEIDEKYIPFYDDLELYNDFKLEYSYLLEKDQYDSDKISEYRQLVEYKIIEVNKESTAIFVLYFLLKEINKMIIKHENIHLVDNQILLEQLRQLKILYSLNEVRSGYSLIRINLPDDYFNDW